MFARVVLSLLLALLPALALADDTDPSVIIERFIQHFVVEPDGSYTLTVDSSKTIVEQRAIEEHGQYYIGYNRTLDEIIAVSAATRKPDGRRVPVLPSDIKDQQEMASADAPMFQDTRLKIIVFPEVEVGDRLDVRYTVRRHTPLFAGQFDDLTAPQAYAHRRFELIYDMPPALALHADAVGFAALPPQAAGGRTRYQWRYQDGPHARAEADAVSYLDHGKRLAVSTFASHADFARAYAARAAPQAAVSPAIAALARSVLPAGASPRERVLGLADWVRQHIRYVAVYVGPGGVVPHAADTVLANRYGDCKDHAVLLEALLRAAGIDSSAALLNNGNAYRLAGVPTLGIVNHVITYVPALDLFLDSTAEDIAPGYLPSALLDKPVLLASSGRLMHTPAHQHEGQRTETRFDIDAGGGSRFSVVRTSTGAMAEPYRQAVRDSGPSERRQLVQSLLKGFGLKGRGTLEPGRLDGKEDEYRIRLSGSSEELADFPGPTGVATHFNFWDGLGSAVAALGREAERTQEFVCPAIDDSDQLILALPPGVNVVALPRAVDVDAGPLAYTSRYSQRDNTVTVNRTLRFRHTGAVCTPALHEQLRPQISRMLRDLRSQVIVQGP